MQDSSKIRAFTSVPCDLLAKTDFLSQFSGWKAMGHADVETEEEALAWCANTTGQYREARCDFNRVVNGEIQRKRIGYWYKKGTRISFQWKQR
jgi:hypothetical protein